MKDEVERMTVIAAGCKPQSSGVGELVKYEGGCDYGFC